MTVLYEFQQQALDAEARHRAEHPDETRLAIVLPTGTGKGTILAERARNFFDDMWNSAGLRVLVLVHADELVNDLAARCRYSCESRPGVDGVTYSVGIVKAGQDDTDADIIVASVQTLANPARRARITDVGLVIVDECHHAVADSYQAILRHFGCMPDCDHPDMGRELDSLGGHCTDCRDAGFTGPPVPALGFTATLERTDGAGLGSVWQNVVFTRDISWAVRKGYLVQPIGYRLEIDLPTDFTVGRDADGTLHPPRWTGHNAPFAQDPARMDAQLCDSIAPERIVEKWQELAADRQTIVFAPLVRSARKIREAFLYAGISAHVIHGDMPDSDRRETIASFKAGKIQVLVNAMVLTEGFDHPGVSCVIVARPTKSRPLFIQMAGRGLRRQPGIPVDDQDCVLITLADTTSDICSVADLSDRLTDRKADGPLTVMEDEWDIGKHLEEAARHWTGRVDATRFDPIVATRSKVWAKTKGGTWFLPISKGREYVFLAENPDGNTDIYVLTRTIVYTSKISCRKVGSAPDLELAMQQAEDEAAERGGDVGALLADKTRAWRKQVPKPGSPMLTYASKLGLDGEVNRIMAARAGGKAGKISDLIRRVEASRSIDKAVERMKERVAG